MATDPRYAERGLAEIIEKNSSKNKEIYPYELDYCIVLDFTMNDPSQIDKDESEVIKKFTHRESATTPNSINDDLAIKPRDIICQMNYNEKEILARRVGHDIVFRATVYGNPDLFKFYQNFNHYDKLNDNSKLDIHKGHLEYEDLMKDEFNIDKPYTGKNLDLIRTMAIPMDEKLPIFKIIVYDNPGISLPIDEYTNYTRRDLFVTAATSIVPKNFKTPKIPGYTPYHQIKLVWNYGFNMSLIESDPEYLIRQKDPMLILLKKRKNYVDLDEIIDETSMKIIYKKSKKSDDEKSDDEKSDDEKSDDEKDGNANRGRRCTIM